MLEENKIYLGDCLEVMKKIDDKSIDLIITDPPYLINYKTSYRKDKTHRYNFVIEGDNDPDLIKEFLQEANRCLKEDTAIYVFLHQTRIDILKNEIEKLFKIKNIIVWKKNNWTAGDLRCSFGRSYEFLILANKGKRKINGKRLNDVWEFSRVVGKKQLHQNEKPVELIKRCIEKHSNENDLILDCFLGSGTTAIACKNTNRRFIGIEKDKGYYDIAIERIAQQDFDYNFGN